MSVHKYGNYTIDTSTLLEKSLEALISRGITHFLGNEQASKVSAWAKKFAEENGAEPAEDEKKAKQAELVAAAFEALNAGTIGTRAGGPKLDPITRAARDIAEDEITRLIKASNQKVPKGKETVSVRGETLTLSDMIDRRLASEKHGPRIAKEAKAAVAARARATEGSEGLDDL